MKNVRQEGSVGIAVLVIILVAALGFTLWWVWDRNRSSEETAHLTVGIFSPTLTTMVADAEGYLEEENVTVEYEQVTGSVQQFESLQSGDYDLILTAPDNVAHYRLNESNALGGTFDVQAVAGTNRGQNISLVVQPDIESFEDLRGKTLAVDSPLSGFAFVLYQMMREHGLEHESDYQITEAGGNAGRYEALLDGEFDGTLLLSGFELRAEDEGMAILEEASAVIPEYLGGVVAGRESWVSENGDTVERLLRAYQKANDWVFDEANREAAIGLLSERTNVSMQLAERLYEQVFVSPQVGIIRDQGISQSEMRTVLQLRQDWGGFDEAQDIDYLSTPEGGLYDLSYLRQ
jgi:ABC-type nitrate/sulfonate/bicarbonate transport system substrate-binding protein